MISPKRVIDKSNNGRVVASNASIVPSPPFSSDLTDTVCDGPNRVLWRHSTQTDALFIDQTAVEIPNPGGTYHGQSEVQVPSTWKAHLGEPVTRHTPSREDTCLHHLLPSVAVCPQGCCRIAEEIIRSGDATTEIDRRQLRRFLRVILIFAFTNLSRSNEPMAASRSSDPCRGTNSHAISNIIEMHTLRGDENPGASTSRTPQLPTAISDNLDEDEYPSTATHHTSKTKKRTCIPPCYLLIFLGLLTVICSLLPGIWRASSNNDLSGGFSLAQYILGVGIFAVGSMVAIHSKSCECWKPDSGVDLVVGGGH